MYNVLECPKLHLRALTNFIESHLFYPFLSKWLHFSLEYCRNAGGIPERRSGFSGIPSFNLYRRTYETRLCGDAVLQKWLFLTAVYPGGDREGNCFRALYPIRFFH